MMETKTHEIADGIFRFSTYVPEITPDGFTFNQFLVKADECGSMNRWLAAAPHAEVAHGGVGVMVSLNDLADRPPRALQDGEVLDLGNHRVRHIDTPHVPHGWEARVLFDETTRTLLCGDLFTHTGDGPPLTSGDIVGAARRAEAMFHFSALSPGTGRAARRPCCRCEPRRDGGAAAGPPLYPESPHVWGSAREAPP